MMPGDARVGMAGAVATVARAALRAAGSENWGVRARSMVMRVGDGHAGHEGTLSAASRSSFPVAESPSLRPESEFAGSSLNDDIGPSSSGSAETGYDVRSFNRGRQRRGDVDRVARQYVYTLHPSSRTSIRPTTLNTLPHVRIPGAPKYVFYFKGGIYRLLLVGPNSLLLPRSSIRMEFARNADEAATNSQSKGSIEKDRVGLHYMRHGKEFLVGVRGSREDVENVKSRIAHFLRDELHLEVGLSSHVHIQSGSVVFLGTRIAGLLDNKTRRRFSKEVEKRRRSKIRAQQMAKVRTETWHNELRDLALQSWAFGLKKTKKELQSWESARQAMYKRSQSLGSKFVLDQIERGMSQDAIQRMLDKEEEVFFDAPSTGLPEAILRAHHRLTRLMEKYLEDETAFEKKAKAVERMRPRVRIGQDDGVIPLQLLAPMEIITEKLRMKGILQPSKALPTVLTSMLSSSDEAIVSYFAALGTCLLSYYRCCDNFQKVRRLVDYQVRWAALFTLGSKHGCSAKKIISQFSRGPRILNRKGSVVVEFPSSPYIARMGKRFLVNVKQNSLDDILRSRQLQLLPSEAKQGPRRVHLREF
ncbi:hypothetical protein M758_3G003800 [Ceratodon purpureus]|nr:hypothetical protein M758_3G003800 [Ceratodon purpureus]